jgi:hypothetical protein
MIADRFEYVLPGMHYPTPEEIERVVGRARRMRKQDFWGSVNGAAKWLARAALSGRATAPAVRTKHA